MQVLQVVATHQIDFTLSRLRNHTHTHAIFKLFSLYFFWLFGIYRTQICIFRMEFLVSHLFFVSRNNTETSIRFTNLKNRNKWQQRKNLDSTASASRNADRDKKKKSELFALRATLTAIVAWHQAIGFARLEQLSLKIKNEWNSTLWLQEKSDFVNKQYANDTTWHKVRPYREKKHLSIWW